MATHPNLSQPGYRKRSRSTPTVRPATRNLQPLSALDAIMALACDCVDRMLGRSPRVEPPATGVWPVATRAECRGKWGSSFCLITEICESGLKLVTGRTHQPGDRLVVACSFDSAAAPIRIACLVTNVTTHEVTAAIVAVDVAQWARVLASLRPAAAPEPEPDARAARRARPHCRTRCRTAAPQTLRRGALQRAPHRRRAPALQDGVPSDCIHQSRAAPAVLNRPRAADRRPFLFSRLSVALHPN